MESLTLSSNRLLRLLVCSLLIVITSIFYPKWRRYTKIRTLKRQHNCKEPAKYPHEDRVLGSDMDRARAQAMKDGRYFRLYGEQFEKYGKTFEEIWRGKPLINTIEPANVQKVAALSFQDYGKDPERAVAQAPLFGPSILFSDGPFWKHSRDMIKPIFSRGEISDIDHLASFVDRFMNLLPDDGGMVDVQPLLRRLFLDVSMGFIFGRSLGYLEPEISTEATEFLEAFEKAQVWTIKRRESGWRQFQFYRKNVDREYKEAYTKVHRYVDDQVARALEETAEGRPTSEGSQAKKRYILLDEMAKQTRDPIQLRYQVLAVFLPARDLIGVSASNMIFQLARHPHIWTQLRRRALEMGDEALTFENLKSLAEFRYVFQETVRTIGPAARVWRIAVRDTVLPVGGGPDQKSPIFVSKGTPVVSGTWAMNHDRETWGDDVEEFQPDRWIGRKTMFEFLPFWGGPRICPAQQQVMTYAIYLLVRLTQRFEHIENCDPVLEYVEKITPSVESRNGVKVAFKND
ncbi:hypothetical protein HYFRA_00001931 [Hymenoscyphus fraxineus]|uniref:Cytochrome P450 alkane hydroxylase-like protein n=1 Tax=Hymenoscyphus fraxineus TaxID=746836 RepID=A0A9N9KLD9_9HELO|nr:hypothetical protein HYFRA_00001931 [Hymenoscyphus fraxineus]